MKHHDCPPWCAVDHTKPVTRLDGTPIMLPDGVPLTLEGHACDPHNAGTFGRVWLAQFPGYAPMLVTASPDCDRKPVRWSLDQARAAADELEAVGVREPADLLRRLVVLAEHSPVIEMFGSAHPEPDFEVICVICPACDVYWPCEPAQDARLPEWYAEHQPTPADLVPTSSEEPF